VCPASGNGNPHLRHIHEKKKIKEKRIGQEGKVEQKGTEQNRAEQNGTERNRTERKHTNPQDLSVRSKITPHDNLSL